MQNMDLYVERQCIEQMKSGDVRQFLLLFDANFVDLYKYVTRRVFEKEKVENIVRLTFLDAIGQIQNTPLDTSYLIWLYSLAKPRVFNYIAKSSFLGMQGIMAALEGENIKEEDREPVGKVDKMFKKLALEEREILRLKFFEQVADGDLITILGIEEGKVGSKIYRVLKRAHFLIFGESGEKQGVYFGELSGLFERVRRIENINVPEVFKLSLKTDLMNRIDRKDFAINGEIIEEQRPKKEPFNVKTGVVHKGSNDPAKIFVEAVKEMREEEAEKKRKEAEKAERNQRIYEALDKWKGVLTLIPVVLFVWIVIFVIFNISGFSRLERGYPTSCDIKVVFEGDFSDAEIRGINEGVSNKICDHFEVSGLKIIRNEEGILDIEVDSRDWFLEYRFVKKIKEWRIKKYARTLNSDIQSGQVS